jgi:hypothetical protein
MYLCAVDHCDIVALEARQLEANLSSRREFVARV